jgi:hypothetical protein
VKKVISSKQSSKHNSYDLSTTIDQVGPAHDNHTSRDYYKHTHPYLSQEFSQPGFRSTNMQFATRTITLIGVLSATALAADVYSHFSDSFGNQIGTTNFDIANDGCFSVNSASTVSFTQAGLESTANGPYCLTGFRNGGCSGDSATQEFANIEINNDAQYSLDDGLVSTGSYKWSAKGC